MDRGLALPHLTTITIPETGYDNTPLALRKVPEPSWKSLGPVFSGAKELETPKDLVKRRRVHAEIEVIRRRFGHGHTVGGKVSTQQIRGPVQASNRKRQ